MPAPGDQYHSANIKNPFDEKTVSNFTAQEIATLQSRLNKQLGPEYISHRQGAGGNKVAYLEGTKAIALANDVFGFNGWSSSLQQVQIDYVDEAPTGKISLGLSMVVRITLKDGTFHEDIGYGMIENCKGKGAAFEKAKKEAATDGLKRALRNFGNVLGNCLYDKEYLKKVGNMKVKPIKWHENRLHRHPDFAPQPAEGAEKEEADGVKTEPHKTPMKPNHAMRTFTGQSDRTASSASLDAEDEFGGNLFDGMEISEEQGDEFTFESMPAPKEAAPKAIEALKKMDSSDGAAPHRPSPGPQNGPPRQAMNRVQSMPAMRQNGAGQPPQQPQQQNQGPPRPGPPPRAPQIPNAQQNMNKPRGVPPAVDIHAPPKPSAMNGNGNSNPPQQNQPLRPTPPQAQNQNQNGPLRPNGPGQPQTPQANNNTTKAPMGFVTSRAAELMQNADPSTTSTISLPAFNPHADSPVPAEKRTPGIDHTRSMKITREAVGAPPAPEPPAQGRPAAAGSGTGQFQRPTMNRSNFVNPQQDGGRRIGMPNGGAGAHAMSPLANRGGYKQPSMVGGVKRPALADVSNQGGKGDGSGEGHEAKKQRVDGVVGGVENALGS